MSLTMTSRPGLTSGGRRILHQFQENGHPDVFLAFSAKKNLCQAVLFCSQEPEIAIGIETSESNESPNPAGSAESPSCFTLVKQSSTSHCTVCGERGVGVGKADQERNAKAIKKIARETRIGRIIHSFLVANRMVRIPAS